LGRRTPSLLADTTGYGGKAKNARDPSVSPRKEGRRRGGIKTGDKRTRSVGAPNAGGEREKKGKNEKARTICPSANRER